MSVEPELQKAVNHPLCRSWELNLGHQEQLVLVTPLWAIPLAPQMNTFLSQIIIMDKESTVYKVKICLSTIS